MAKIIVSGSIVVPSGPQIPFNQTLDVDAYDKIDVAVKAGEGGKNIELQPGAAGQVQLLAIVSDWYSEDLSFKINKTGDPFALDGPVLCMGKGGVSLFDKAPQTLFFINGSKEKGGKNAPKGAKDAPKENEPKDAPKEKDVKDANIQILIGRAATA